MNTSSQNYLYWYQIISRIELYLIVFKLPMCFNVCVEQSYKAYTEDR